MFDAFVRKIPTGTHPSPTLSGNVFDVYVHGDALRAAERHFSEASELGLEALGLFSGGAYAYSGRPYAVLERYITAQNDATAVSVRFSRGAFSALAASIEGGRRLCAWAHSHPGYGCFLSSTDLRTQRAYFWESYHAALVVDPVRGQRKFFKLSGDSYEEASYAVIRPSKQAALAPGKQGPNLPQGSKPCPTRNRVPQYGQPRTLAALLSRGLT